MCFLRGDLTATTSSSACVKTCIDVLCRCFVILTVFLFLFCYESCVLRQQDPRSRDVVLSPAPQPPPAAGQNLYLHLLRKTLVRFGLRQRRNRDPVTIRPQPGYNHRKLYSTYGSREGFLLCVAVGGKQFFPLHFMITPPQR